MRNQWPLESMLIGESGNVAEVNADGQVHVVLEGSADSNNSTEVALGIDGVFTGTATNTKAYAAITILIEADQISASGGLAIQFSADGSAPWHDGESYTIPASIAKFFSPPVQAEYFRIVYTNGGVAQSSFHLHTMLKKQPIKWSSHNLQDNLNDEDDATLSVVVPKLRTAANTYVSAAATATGNFKMSLEELESGVSSNSNSQLNITQFDSSGNEIGVDGVTNSIQTVEYEHHEIHSGSHYYIEGHATLDTAGVLYTKLVTPDTGKWAHFTWKISSNGILESTLFEIPTGGMTGGSRATIHANNRNTNCWAGRQDGGDNQATLTDSTQSWTIDALIGLQIFNQTDGSSGMITDNDATTVTATLSGGTDNDWDDDDLYEINNSQLVITGGVTVATSLGLEISDSDVGGTGFKSDVGGESKRTDELILRQNTIYLRRFISGSDANIISFKASWYEHQNKN